MNHKNKSQGTDEKIVRQLAPANENLTGNVLKTILTANKVKEQICCMKSKVLGSVARKVDNFIQRLVTFSNFLNMFSNFYNPDKKSLFSS